MFGPDLHTRPWNARYISSLICSFRKHSGVPCASRRDLAQCRRFPSSQHSQVPPPLSFPPPPPLDPLQPLMLERSAAVGARRSSWPPLLLPPGRSSSLSLLQFLRLLLPTTSPPHHLPNLGVKTHEDVDACRCLAVVAARSPCFTSLPAGVSFITPQVTRYGVPPPQSTRSLLSNYICLWSFAICPASRSPTLISSPSRRTVLAAFSRSTLRTRPSLVIHGYDCLPLFSLGPCLLLVFWYRGRSEPTSNPSTSGLFLC